MFVRNGERLGSVLVSRETGTEPAPQPDDQLTDTEREADRQAAEARQSQPAEEGPLRPPTSGPGSGVEAWRRYASEVTGSPPESWAQFSRDDIIELMDSETGRTGEQNA